VLAHLRFVVHLANPTPATACHRRTSFKRAT
jgi:hypothetical protein